MKVTVATSFDELREQLGEQAGSSNTADFFLSPEWFEILFTHGLSAGYLPRIYIVSQDREPLVALYCCHRGVGGTLFSLTSFYSISYQPVTLSNDADPPQVLNALIEYVAAERPRWHTVELRFMRADLPGFAHLETAFQQNNFALHRFHQYENWVAPVDDARFEHYWSQRPSQLRNTVRRREKKAGQRHQLQTRILVEAGKDLEDAISGYTQVYESSWKQSEPFVQFMPSLIRRCADLSVLRLGELRLDDIPVASQVWIVSGGRAVIYKLAYDEKYKDLSVGSILSARLFEHVLNIDHVRELDYGVGSEAYKKEWMTEVRTIEGIAAYNLKTAGGLARAAAESGRQLLRPLRAMRISGTN